MNAAGCYYLFYFAALGAFLPFYGPLLESFGLSTTAATQVIAIGPLCGLLAPPLMGALADSGGARRHLLRALSLLALVAFTGFFYAEQRPLVVLVTAVGYSIARTSLVALADANALLVGVRRGVSYGRLRSLGSLGFLLAAAAVGATVSHGEARPILAITAALLAGSAIIAWVMPVAEGERPRSLRGGWREWLARREIRLFLAAATLGALANGVYDAGFSLHLSHLGLGDSIGLAWGVAVAAEVPLMLYSGRLVARLGADRTLMVAFAAAVLRWSLLAVLRAPAAIIAVQPLHALTFGLYWVSCVTFVFAEAGATMGASVQGLLVAATSLGTITGMCAAGPVLEHLGGGALFGGAAVVSAAATATAARFSRVSREARGAAPSPTRSRT